MLGDTPDHFANSRVKVRLSENPTFSLMASMSKGRKVSAMGKPTPTTILEVHDDAGAQAAPGVVGEIVYWPRRHGTTLPQGSRFRARVQRPAGKC